RAPTIRGTGLWNGTVLLGLFRLDVRELDHLGPLFEFSSVELSVVGRRKCKHGATQVDKARLDLGINEGGVDLPIEPIHDLGGRSVGDSDATYRTGLVARYELADGRDVRQQFRSRCSRHRKGPQPAISDVLDRRGHVVEYRLHLA